MYFLTFYYVYRLGTSNNYSPDNEDITANLVELCPRPLPATNSSERTSSLRPIQQVTIIYLFTYYSRVQKSIENC